MQKANCNAANMLVKTSSSRPVQRMHWDNAAFNTEWPTVDTIFRFVEPCIVIYLYNKNQQNAHFLH